MNAIPRPVLLLGLSGLLPFVWGAATALSPSLTVISPAGFAGSAALSSYGTVILAFMSGVIWGFATRAPGWGLYALSVLPALWAWVAAGSLPGLLAGFVALLSLDVHAARAGLAPDWWLPLRLILTSGVVLALMIGILAP